MSENREAKNRLQHLVLAVAGLALVGVANHPVQQHSRLQIVAQATDPRPAPHPNAPAPANPGHQASPQGPTGPLDTTSGGAPAASPQGDTPSGMQAAPQGSDKAIRSPSK